MQEIICRVVQSFADLRVLVIGDAMVFEQGRAPYRTYAQPRPQCRAAGAGDTYAGAFTLALAAGASTPVAAELAAAAAAIVVAKSGTATCNARELLNSLTMPGKIATEAPGPLPERSSTGLIERIQERGGNGPHVPKTNHAPAILCNGHARRNP